ncbi:MAG: DUF2807 domain-containing protein [Pyrinomonadaceae bacterium]|nr:DUF2807 domain-containing protein [Pyrinomonadaceae bacterium]
MKKIGVLVFILALIVGSVAAYIFSVGNFFSDDSISIGLSRRTSPSGNVVVEKREVSDFKAVQVSGLFTVEIVAQKEFSLEVETDDNILQYIKTEVNDGVLVISKERGWFKKFRAKIRISAPHIEGLEVSGVTKTSLENLDGESLKIELSGASKIEASGKVNDLEIDMNGASKLNAKGLKAVNVSVDGSGASRAYVSVRQKLNSDLSGASRVSYYGDPAEINKENSGASSLRQAGE